MAPINWLQKVAQDILGNVSEWNDGDLAILTSFGWRDFSVVEVISWENVSILSDEHKDIDENTISTDRGTMDSSWTRGEAVPFKILNTYSDSETGESRYHQPGTIRLAGPQNLFRTLEDLMKQQSQSLYPDITMSIIQKPHIAALTNDFPQLIGNLSPSDHIDYQTFDIDGYEVQVMNDKQAIERNPGIMQTRYRGYYWHIPELQTRSFDDKEGIDKSPWGTGRYPTMQRALEAAEQYLNHLFPGEV